MDIPTTHVVPGRANEFRVGDVFGRSFELFARRFLPFFGLTVVAYLPSYALTFLVGNPEAGSGLVGLISFIATVVCGALASAAVTYGVVQELRGRRFTFSESLGIALRRAVPMIGVGLCVGLLVGLGAVLLIIPGLIALCVYYVAAQACVVERTGVIASLKRSAALTKGHRWQIFGIVLVLVVVNIGVALLLGVLVAVLFAAATPGFLTISGLVGGVWQAFVAAFGAVLGGVLYFRLRSVKEGFDIDQIASVFD
jgi:uncharacterized membrane protein